MSLPIVLNQRIYDREAMDLLDSILGSMDKPPSLSENEKKAAKG